MTMPLKSERYINAERLKGVVNVRSSHWLCGWDTLGVLSVIDEQPTADVAPVVHGHWYFTEYEYFTCSVCGKSYYNGCESSEEARNRLKEGDVFDFCPHCGAKMDEETNNGKE